MNMKKFVVRHFYHCFRVSTFSTNQMTPERVSITFDYAPSVSWKKIWKRNVQMFVTFNIACKIINKLGNC